MEEKLGELASQGILPGILVLLCLNLLARIGEFLFRLLKEKSKKSDYEITNVSLALSQNSQEMREMKSELRIQLGMLERKIEEVQKFKSDLQKVFSAIKIMAGPKWPKLRKAIEEDVLPNS